MKRYELHPKLGKDPKKQQYLIDIYYSETSMNNFKSSVITQLDRLNQKMTALEKDFGQQARLIVRPKTPDGSECVATRNRYETELKWKKEVLINCIVTALFEDLRTVQSTMRQFEQTLVEPAEYIRALVKKQDGFKPMLQEA